jgi:transcriptional regulator with XRE-family HTH domain
MAGSDVFNRRLYLVCVCDCGLDDLVVAVMMSVNADLKCFETWIADMKRDESPLLPPARLQEARELGEKLARLRMARHLRQVDAAARAGLARSTAALIEKGDIGRTQSQILRYLEAIAPGVTMLALLQETDPALQALSARELTQRVRPLSKGELEKLDF